MNGQHESFEDIPRIAGALRDEIQQSTSLVIVTHARVDADAVGSAVSFADVCESLGSSPTAVAAGDFRVPPNLEFIDSDGNLAACSTSQFEVADLVIFVDCADQDRAGLVSQVLRDRSDSFRIINIDHHVTNTRFGDVNLIIPQAAATCELLVPLFRTLGLDITPRTATALLAGIYGDTLGLKTPSTTPGSMRACAELHEAGAHLDLIVDKLFRKKPMSTVHLWGEVQSRAAWRGRLVWSLVTEDMLERSGAAASQTEGLVNFLAGVEGAFAATLIQEAKDGWRVSLRSTTSAVDVSELAKRFGGGGHPRAAGCRLPEGRQAVEDFLSHIASELDALPEHAGARLANVAAAD